jgi:hypothetical protein
LVSERVRWVAHQVTLASICNAALRRQAAAFVLLLHVVTPY